MIQSDHSLIKSPKEELKEILDKEKVAYAVEALLWKNGSQKKVRIRGTRAKADQGCDIVIINPTLAKHLTLDLRDVKELDNRVLTMTASHGSDTELKQWAKLWVDVAGVQRETWAFVGQEDHPNHSVLLRLPWLKSVAARFDCKKEWLAIGDTDVGEKRRWLMPVRLKSAGVLHEAKGEMQCDSSDSYTETEDEDDSSDEESTEEEFEDVIPKN